MKGIITVGLGFGDEGKGATVDYLARRFHADLVVRYSGGAQAGHNVQLPDGSRHTFSQFGAGTLAGVRSYLGRRVVVCPQTLNPEAEHLKRLGIDDPFSTLSLHPDCLLSTSFHIAMNRLREIDRGAGRHGSCGLGIGEARSYWLKHGKDAVVAADVLDRNNLVAKLTLLRDRMLLELQSLHNVDAIYAEGIYLTNPSSEADHLIEVLTDVAMSEKLPDAKRVIFEGAQGVLLDEYFGFHPHTTWSTVTSLHAREIVEENDFESTTTLGLTRAYSTRHGAGPFPTYCRSLSQQIHDAGNPTNDWQGQILSGPLDLVLLRYALAACERAMCPVDGLVVNNLDELPERPSISERYHSTTDLTIPRTIHDQAELTHVLNNAEPAVETLEDERILIDRLNEYSPVVLTSSGPTFEDRSETMRFDSVERAIAGKLSSAPLMSAETKAFRLLDPFI